MEGPTRIMWRKKGDRREELGYYRIYAKSYGQRNRMWENREMATTTSIRNNDIVDPEKMAELCVPIYMLLMCWGSRRCESVLAFFFSFLISRGLL